MFQNKNKILPIEIQHIICKYTQVTSVKVDINELTKRHKMLKENLQTQVDTVQMKPNYRKIALQGKYETFRFTLIKVDKMLNQVLSAIQSKSDSQKLYDSLRILEQADQLLKQNKNKYESNNKIKETLKVC